MKNVLLVILLSLFFATPGITQPVFDSVKGSYSYTVSKPSCILVMLHLSTIKIEGMKKYGMSDDIAEVMRGDAYLNDGIMNDFATNFTFCPVYFFYDTCYEKAKNKEWSKITFYDYESLSKKKRVFSNLFSNYFFAEIGYRAPAAQLEIDSAIHERRIDRLQGEEGVVAARKNGFNMYNIDFKPLQGKLAFTEVSLRRRKGVAAFMNSPAMKLEKKFRLIYDPKPVAE